MKQGLLLLFAGLMIGLSVRTVQAAERIELHGTVRGNQEQPGVLFIVPWQNPPSPAIRTDGPPKVLDGIGGRIDRSLFRQQLYFREHLELGEPDKETTSK